MGSNPKFQEHIPDTTYWQEVSAVRKTFVFAVFSILALALIGFVALGPAGPFARRGAPAPAPGPAAHSDDPNRAEDDIPSETPAPSNLPKATSEGNQVLSYRTEDGIKVFELTAKPIQWEVKPNEWIEAWAYNGTVPGPTFRVQDGDRVRVIFHNQLPEPSAVHWHGQTVPWGQDGVPGLTQQPVPPGQSFVYEFNAGPAGTHWYHTHFNTTHQVTSGLFGAFIIDPKGGPQPKVDREHTLFITDAGALGLTMNGHSYPRNQPLMVKKGERVLIRMINAGAGPHPMHLHGHVSAVVAKDGAPVDKPLHVDTLAIFPGETYDLAFTADNPGAWVFHCHMPNHAEGPTGMFGLTQEVRYEDVPNLPPPGSAASHGGEH